MNKDIMSPPKTALNRRNELPNDLSADVGMENDSARVSLQETTEAEPGIEHETNMGSAADGDEVEEQLRLMLSEVEPETNMGSSADDGDHDQEEEQLRLMFSEESPPGQILGAKQALEVSQENGRLQAEEGRIQRKGQVKDPDGLKVTKVADYCV